MREGNDKRVEGTRKVVVGEFHGNDRMASDREWNASFLYEKFGVLANLPILGRGCGEALGAEFVL
jgi:hypothetical protein